LSFEILAILVAMEAPPPHAITPAPSTPASIVGGVLNWKFEIRNPKSEIPHS
jgi:hypothetical protein